FRRRVAPGRTGMGTPGGPETASGRLAARDRRSPGEDLPDHLPGAAVAFGEGQPPPGTTKYSKDRGHEENSFFRDLRLFVSFVVPGGSVAPVARSPTHTACGSPCRRGILPTAPLHFTTDARI